MEPCGFCTCGLVYPHYGSTGELRRPGKQQAREGERRLRVIYSHAVPSVEATKKKIN